MLTMVCPKCGKKKVEYHSWMYAGKDTGDYTTHEFECACGHEWRLREEGDTSQLKRFN